MQGLQKQNVSVSQGTSVYYNGVCVCASMCMHARTCKYLMCGI
jgi:hypothetical protein